MFPLPWWFWAVRLHRPLPMGLLCVPCLWGAMLAQGGPFPWAHTVVLLAGAVWMRSWGCLFNDYQDRHIDKHVARTRHRPIASGLVCCQKVRRALFFLALPGLVFLLLPWPPVCLGLAACALTPLYPLAKRFCGFPQLFLAGLFNMGFWIAYSWGAGETVWGLFHRKHGAAWVAYGACMLWTVEYDTLYAYQDRKEDAALGVGSLAVTLGTGPAALLFLGTILVARGFLVFSVVHTHGLAENVPLLLLTAWYLVRGVTVCCLSLHNPDSCRKAFHTSLWEGFFVLLAFWRF